MYILLFEIFNSIRFKKLYILLLKKEIYFEKFYNMNLFKKELIKLKDFPLFLILYLL